MAAISALAPFHLRPTRPLAAANLPPHPTPPHPPESSGSVFPPPAPCRPTDGLSSASPPPLHFLRPLVRFAVTPFCRVDGSGRRLATGRRLSLPRQPEAEPFVHFLYNLCFDPTYIRATDCSSLVKPPILQSLIRRLPHAASRPAGSAGRFRQQGRCCLSLFFSWLVRPFQKRFWL